MIGGVQVMGIVNATPDSFSDGGRWLEPAAGIAHGEELIGLGADIIDIGGESTRPGALRVDPATEQARILPIVRGLAGSGAELSIDTLNAGTAAAAVDAGVTIINDVSGGLADPGMLQVAADTGARIVLMHWRGFLTVGERPHYTDVVTEVIAELDRRVDAALVAGVAPEQIILDPGLGFSKNAEHNWAILRDIDAFTSGSLPVLIGASRKRFLATLTGGLDTSAASLALRDAATAALSTYTARKGAWGVRVHDVAGTVAALKVWAELVGEPDRG